MPFIPSTRLTNLGIFLAAGIAMLFALWLQYGQHLEPCPLCIFQRVAMIATGSIALIAFLHGAKGIMRRLYAVLTFLATIAGMIVAGRHVWLQHLPPDEVPACGPGLNYWLETFPLHEVMAKVFHGSGECAAIDWTLFGLALPTLTLMAFIGLGAVALWQIIRKEN
jgi:disulfide bond formation protein DsbB